MKSAGRVRGPPLTTNEYFLCFRHVRAPHPQSQSPSLFDEQYTSALSPSVPFCSRRAQGEVTHFRGKRRKMGSESPATDGEYIYFSWEENIADIWVMDVSGRVSMATETPSHRESKKLCVSTLRLPCHRSRRNLLLVRGCTNCEHYWR